MLPLPLALHRVLDLTTSNAGAYATRLLGDLGAEVIRVEGPGANQAATDLHCDKLSCAIDLSRAEGRELCLRLVEGCNLVFVDADAPLDYESCAGPNGAVIYVSLSGQDGPEMGVAAAAAAIAALFHHRGTGGGQRIEVNSEGVALSLQTDRVLAASAGLELLAESTIPTIEAPSGFLEMVSQTGGIRSVTGLPYRLSRTPVHIRLPAPMAGQHTAYVLRDLLRLEPGAVTALQEGGVVGR
jgi:crotonobetainyl-CoA:carnitine CoA-transferase CaiB-like acyl-CoA transferase